MPESRVRSPKVKICGLRDSQHALAAARAGADYLGFVFVEGVRRQLHPDEGASIVKTMTDNWANAADAARNPRQWLRPRAVALARSRQDEVASGPGSRSQTHRDDAGFATSSARKRGGTPRLVGLFRNQPVEWVRETAGRVGLDIAQLCGEESLAYGEDLGIPVLRQVRVRAGQSPKEVSDEVRAWLDAGHMVVLDAFDPTTPGGAGVAFNWKQASEAVDAGRVLLAGGLTPENVGHAVDQLHPWGVDVSSGVETGGLKDANKIELFIRMAKRAT